LLVLGFELRALYLLDRCFRTWAMPPLLFTLLIFQIEYYTFCKSCPWAAILISIPPTWLGWQVLPPHPACSLRWELSNFWLSLALNYSPPSLPP
jgi:hypothetical protein